ncbi:MAG: riboflavin synthase [Planctomycetota bacterium]|nr:riboflavin synthase [Planctomycetota bacterium]
MFTGLVEAVGVVRDITQRGPAASAITRLVVEAREWPHRPELGESISVNGCCLTLAAPLEQAGGAMAFDAVPETLSKTTLGTLRPGSRVNLEKSATPTTLLGGHIVQGHVDGVGRVVHVQRGEDWRVRVEPPTAMMEYIVPKGSITMQGVSLTIAALDVKAGWFEVALIPTTLQKTTLAELDAGHGVNLEADAMAKTIIHWLKHFAQRGT